jgi:hypothetical protein
MVPQAVLLEAVLLERSGRQNLKAVVGEWADPQQMSRVAMPPVARRSMKNSL